MAGWARLGGDRSRMCPKVRERTACCPWGQAGGAGSRDQAPQVDRAGRVASGGPGLSSWGSTRRRRIRRDGRVCTARPGGLRGARAAGGRAASGGELGFDAEGGLVEALLVHHEGPVQQVLGDLRVGRERGRGCNP